MIYLSCRSLTQMGKQLTSFILLILYYQNNIEKWRIKIYCIGLQFQVRIQSYEKQAVEEDPFKKKWDSEFSRNNGPMYRSRSQQKLWIQVMNSCRYTAFEIANLNPTSMVIMRNSRCQFFLGGVKLQTTITLNIIPKQHVMTHISDINRGPSQRLLQSEISF